MESKSYTTLDRTSVLETLESRLSAGRSSPHGPQVQLFRISSPPPATSSLTMPHLMPDKPPQREESIADPSPVSPSEDLIQTYNKRIQIMQAVINQLRGAAKERQRWEEDAKKARIELEVAKIRIADLENELDQGPEAPEETVKQDHVIAAYGMRDQKKTDEAENKNGGLEDANNSPAERPANQEEQGRACDDVICLHHVAWGSGSIHDKALDRRLLDCAAHNSSFTVTREFIGRGVRTGERRTLVIAYSVPPDGSMRWLVVDEGHKGRFDR